MTEDLRIGFVGAGKMASALAKGFVRAGLVEATRIRAADPAADARSSFARETGAEAIESNEALAKCAQLLFVAVKPGMVTKVLAELKPLLPSDVLIVSIAAGVSLKTLQEALAPGTRVVRVMPNTPALVGASASGYSLGAAATRADAERVQRLLSAVGRAAEVPEKLLDAVTGLSGSGPAYVYLIIEALSDGGVAAGLPRALATELAAQTVLGAARLVLESGLHPGALKDMVTSPGGTTIEGVHELEKAGLRGALMSAVRAAAAKATQLGQG